jgi:alpha-D-xyloside xylohydrolase
MDYASDRQVLDIDNEFMYGQSILVAPVTEKDMKFQPVYLPAGTSWYDFWTGEITKGGTTINKATPINIIPLYIKAGSILPWGPDVQYAEEKKWSNLEIRIYPGEDAHFTLYEDENNGYNYEKGICSGITFHWDDANTILTIDDRKGSFPGMLESRKFNITLVKEGRGSGIAFIQKPDKIVEYKGKKIIFKL